MDTQQPEVIPIDPLRRIFVPNELETKQGTTVFKTHDGAIYCRLTDGSIRLARPKLNKAERKMQKRAKHAART